MAFISITRLRVRSLRFLPAFGVHTSRSIRQVKRAPGFRGGSLLADRQWAFWTMTAWDNRDSMRDYMTAGSHRAAMPRLLDWCDEASVVHWDMPDDSAGLEQSSQGDGLPSWTEADRRMRQDGRASKVRHPSPDHAGLTFRAPRLTGGGPIRPARD